MRGKLVFVAGIAVGYVVGARAGRSAYDAVVERVKGVTQSPAVQQAGEKAKATLEDRAPKVAEALGKVAGTASAAAAAASAASEAGDAASEEDDRPTTADAGAAA